MSVGGEIPDFRNFDLGKPHDDIEEEIGVYFHIPLRDL